MDRSGRFWTFKGRASKSLSPIEGRRPDHDRVDFAFAGPSAEAVRDGDARGNMPRARELLVASSILLLCLPVSVLATLMLLPVWARIGSALGVAAVGPTGPAAWCFVLVYLLLAALGTAVML